MDNNETNIQQESITTQTNETDTQQDNITTQTNETNIEQDNESAKNIQSSNQQTNKNNSKAPIIIILIIVILLAGSYIAMRMLNKDNTPTPDDKKDTKEVVLLKDSNKEVVYSYIDENLKNANYSTTITIPQFNIDSTDAENINKKILDKYEKILDECREIEKDNSRVFNNEIGYKYYVNDNIVSLVIYHMATEFSSMTNFEAYNIDQVTGKEVSTSEILKYKNIDESNFSSILVDAYKNARTIDEQLKNDDFAKSQYQKNIDKLNNQDIMGIYLNENSELCIIFEEDYWVATNFVRILNIEKKTLIENGTKFIGSKKSEKINNDSNKTTQTTNENTKTDEELVKELFVKDYLLNDKAEKLLDYKITEVRVLSESEKKDLVETSLYESTDILAYVSYQVKVEDPETSAWNAGNGSGVDGQWLLGKTACVRIRDGKLTAGTGW